MERLLIKMRARLAAVATGTTLLLLCTAIPSYAVPGGTAENVTAPASSDVWVPDLDAPLPDIGEPLVEETFWSPLGEGKAADADAPAEDAGTAPVGEEPGATAPGEAPVELAPEPDAAAAAAPTIYSQLGEQQDDTFYDFTSLGDQSDVAVRVHVATGNLLIKHRVAGFPGPGVPADLWRIHNSNTDVEGEFGSRWRISSLMAGLSANVSGSYVDVYSDTGAKITFDVSGTTYIPRPGANASLRKNADGTWRLQYNRTGEIWNFTSFGRPF